MKSEQSLVKRQIGGSNEMEFDEFDIHRKLMKRGIQRNQN